MGVHKHSVLNLFHKAAHQICDQIQSGLLKGCLHSVVLVSRHDHLHVLGLVSEPAGSCRAVLLICPVSCSHHLSVASAVSNRAAHSFVRKRDLRSLASMTSVQALFYDSPGAYILFPRPELICCISSRTLTETSSAAAAPVSAPSADICTPKASMMLLSRDVGPQVRATAFWAQGFFFFFLLKEQTMISWNNAADERLSKENKALTSWVLKACS